MLTRFLWGAAVLGIVAAYVVPGLSRVLRNILPTQVSQFLPADTFPPDIMTGIVSSTVNGVLLAASFWILAQAGVKVRVPKVGG